MLSEKNKKDFKIAFFQGTFILVVETFILNSVRIFKIKKCMQP